LTIWDDGLVLSYVADWESSRCLSICGTMGSCRTVNILSALMSKHDFLVNEINENERGHEKNYRCECTHTREDNQCHGEFA